MCRLSLETSKYEVVDQIAESQIEDVYRLFQGERWTRTRTPEDIRRMLAHTDVVVGLVDTADGRLVGFARALTDRLYRATVYDIIVESGRRGQGLGRMLLDAIVD